MEQKPAAAKAAKKITSSRDDRLKAALKANLSRRKQLARAKSSKTEQTDVTNK
jgi:hypothetical protein